MRVWPGDPKSDLRKQLSNSSSRSVQYDNSSRDPSGHWDALGLSATRLMKSQLYAVGAADAPSYIIAALIPVSVPFSRGFCPRGCSSGSVEIRMTGLGPSSDALRGLRCAKSVAFHR